MDKTEKQVSETVLTIMSHLRSVLSKCTEQQNENTPFHHYHQQKCHYTSLQDTERCPRTRSPKTRTWSLKPPVSEKEKLGKLIAEATAENFELRDSNVQLRRLSKLQDCRVRELKYKVSLQGQRIAKERAVRKSILDMENVLKGKVAEIQKLKSEIREVKKKIPDDMSSPEKAFRPSRSPKRRPPSSLDKSMAEGKTKLTKSPTKKLSDEHSMAGKSFRPPSKPSRRLSDEHSTAGESFMSPNTPWKRLSDDNSMAGDSFRSPKTPSRRLFEDNSMSGESLKPPKTPSRRLFEDHSMSGESFRSPKTPTSGLQLFDNKSNLEQVPKSPTRRLQFPDSKSTSETTFRHQKSPSRRMQMFGNKSSSETTLKPPPRPPKRRLQSADNNNKSTTPEAARFRLPRTPTQSSKSAFFSSKKQSKSKKESTISRVLSKLSGILSELNSCRAADIGNYGPCRKILAEIQDRVLYLLGRENAHLRNMKHAPTHLQPSPDYTNCARDKGDGRTVKVEIFECMDKAVQVSMGDWSYYTKAP